MHDKRRMHYKNYICCALLVHNIAQSAARAPGFARVPTSGHLLDR